MQVLRSYEAIPDALKGCVLAIGNFDGVHVGHRAVLDAALSLAKQHHVPCVVMTFHPHPKRYFAPDHAPQAIEPRHMKLRRLRAIGLDAVLTLPFNAALASMRAEQFIEVILCQALGVTHVVVGEDFHFGHQRGGNIDTLKDAAQTHHFGFTHVPPVMQGDTHISSSRIRARIAEGDMEEAASLLGRPYQLYGRVVHGEKRGRELGVRTANIRLDCVHQPAYGVYAVQFALLESANCAAHPPHWRDGVANIGVRPTFGDNAPLLEVHSLTPLSEEAYGMLMRVRLLHFIRAEQRFDDAEALMAQINHDVMVAKQYLADNQAYSA